MWPYMVKREAKKLEEKLTEGARLLQEAGARPAPHPRPRWTRHWSLPPGSLLRSETVTLTVMHGLAV